VAQNPDDAALLNALGYLLTDQFAKHAEARGYIQRALAMNPDSAAIIDSMGWVLYKLGDYRGALDYLERAYRLEPEPEIASHLVVTRWHLGQHDSARELLQEALNRAPTTVTSKKPASNSANDALVAARDRRAPATGLRSPARGQRQPGL